MKSYYFLHEFRTASRESRSISAIPGLLALMTFGHWLMTHRLTRDGYDQFAYTQTSRIISEFLQSGWPYVGWLVPWFLLRRLGLHDPEARWRTTPTGKWPYFCAHLTWVLVATVGLPAVIVAAVCALEAPHLIQEQVTLIAWSQITLFAVGAFAAFAGKKNRGAWIVLIVGALWFVTNLLAEETAQWILAHLVLKDTVLEEGCAARDEYIFPFVGWPAQVPWVVLPCILLPWIFLKIRRPGKESSWWTWPVGCTLLAIISQSVLFYGPCLRPHYPEETLPVKKIELSKSSVRKSGHSADGYNLGSADFPLPGNDLRVAWDNHQVLRGSVWVEIGYPRSIEGLISGVWHSDSMKGEFSPQLFNSRLRLTCNYREGDDGQIPSPGATRWDNLISCNRVGYYGAEFIRPLSQTFHTTGVKLWTATRTGNWHHDEPSITNPPNYEWVDTNNFQKTGQTIALCLTLPTQWGERCPDSLQPGRFSKLQGGIIHGTVKMHLLKTKSPVIAGRFPIKQGGSFTTSIGESFTITPAKPDDPWFLVTETYHQGPLRKNRLERCYLPITATRDTRVMLYNAKNKEGIILGLDFLSVGIGTGKAKFAARLPENAPKLSAEWYEDAEFVFLRYDHTPVTLPIEFTLKL